ncbi:DNA cytosine methyltransferase [Methylocella sp.]|jgi:DNA (cytosine-5)-methyltransferase 1|uniref:DNA cytosine methyltransferase n=1 Tax=Methylocella sp. TaxID=1978226 RepID=UPI003C2A2D33
MIRPDRKISHPRQRTRAGASVGECRFDGVAGALRTSSGGSSRQSIIFVDGDDIRTRLLTPRECARLMGLPDSYILPESENEALFLCGDGVVEPVVRHPAAHLFEPLLEANAIALTSYGAKRLEAA